jgi:hypothetical protein
LYLSSFQTIFTKDVELVLNSAVPPAWNSPTIQVNKKVWSKFIEDCLAACLIPLRQNIYAHNKLSSEVFACSKWVTTEAKCAVWANSTRFRKLCVADEAASAHPTCTEEKRSQKVNTLVFSFSAAT